MSEKHVENLPEAVAIVGLACRFPGAADVQAFWRNLVAGVESIRRYSADELRACGLDPALLGDPRFVPAGALIDDHDRFDAAFFGFTPREAQLLDPQHRVFFECAWSALEDAGCDPARSTRAIGVFAGTSLNTYLLYNLVPNPDVIDAVGLLQACIASDKDFLATHVSYKLDLRGPSLAVQTACSTSLVAVQLAFQSLMTWQCDVALAGGVSVQVPHVPGYRYDEGGIVSPDGRCRAFDAAAQGTVKGNGAGVVVLKRLSDALADGDRIVAVIRGAAVNNDGAMKVGFTAPGVDGQAEVIATAHAQAGVGAESIGLIEAHGTATPLGDPVEVSALTRVFRASTPRTSFCALGAVKSNIGHLDAAAGVAGLIKAALAVERGVIPPTVHFQTPNPGLDLPASPFYVNAEARAWTPAVGPRRAGVSSFGLGGTNAHVVLEQAPDRAATDAPRASEILVLSARTPTALAAARQRLAAHLRAGANGVNLGDVAWTLQTGRAVLPLRCAIAAGSPVEAADLLESMASATAPTVGPPRAVFVFPGHGSQYARMGAGLFAAEPAFAEEFDRVDALFERVLGRPLRRDLVEPAGDATLEAEAATTTRAMPALFAFEYALARWWMRLGVTPDAMIGHSLGEYVAACLAGVMRLEDAVTLVAARARLMDSLPPGRMLAVRLGEADVQPWLGAAIALAAVNGPRSCVLSGPPDAIDLVAAALDAAGVQARVLRSTRALHSGMLDPILEAFRTVVRRIRFAAPAQPYVSTLTGTWIRPDQATDPDYWVQHLRQTVRFDQALRTVLDDPARVPIEIGPGQALTRLAQAGRAPTSAPAIATVRGADDPADDLRTLMRAVGQAWVAGLNVDWTMLHDGRRRRRVGLPTYAFDRVRCWIDPPAARTIVAVAAPPPTIDSWLYVPYWRPIADPPVAAVAGTPATVVVFADGDELESAAVRAIELRGDRVIRVRSGAQFSAEPDGSFVVGARPEDYASLFDDLSSGGRWPARILHLWSVPGHADHGLDQTRGFASLLWIAQAVGRGANRPPLHLVVATSALWQVHERDRVRDPWRATVLGPCHVIPQEDAGVQCRLVDLEGEAPDAAAVARLADELHASTGPTVVAYRAGRRWERTFERCAASPVATSRFVPGGVYWITGGTGGIGLAIARWLAREYRARLVLTQRTPVPPRHEWASRVHATPRDPQADRLRALMDIEAVGGELLVLPADVTRLDDLQAVAAMIRDRFGRLDGVIHTAGVPGGGLISLKTIEAAAEVMAPKVDGTEHVARVAREAGAGFLALCSSIAGLQGGFGQIDYAGANAALDAFAAWHTATTGLPTFAIDWDAWREAGMGVEAHARIAARLGGAGDAGATDGQVGLRNDQGAEAFRRVVDSRHPQVVVSTVDLVSRIADQRLALSTLTTPVAAGPAADGRIADTGSVDLEARIAAVWERVLGVTQIGWDQNFFELGGDSLAGVQVIAHLHRELGLQVSVAQFFEAPTVAALATLMRGPTEADAKPLELSRDRGRLRRERHDQRRAKAADATR